MEKEGHTRTGKGRKERKKMPKTWTRKDTHIQEKADATQIKLFCAISTKILKL
jgi:hypothetical protein